MNASLFRILPLLLSLLLSPSLARAQENKAESSSNTTTSVVTTSSLDAPPASPAAPAEPASTATPPPSSVSVTISADVQPSEPAEPALRSLTNDEAKASNPEATGNDEQTVVPATTAKDTGAPAEKSKKPAKVKKPRAPRHDGPQSQPFAQIEIKKGDTAHDAVSVLGSTKVDGEVSGDAVAVLGPNTITGKVAGNAVAVLNDLSIDGEVHGDAVCVLGNIKFGPNAHVHGQVVSVLGLVERDPEAVIDGQMNIVGAQLPGGVYFSSLGTWFKECLAKGRLLAFHGDLGIFWLFAISITLFQILIALLFSRKVNHCAQLLETRPGYSLLSAMLTLLIAPLLVLLLIATGIGLLLVPFIVIGLFAIGVFGRVVIQAALGRLITGRQSEGPLANAALTTLIGGTFVLLLYTVPVLALLLHPLLGFLGTGVVVYALIQYYRSSRDKGTPTPPPARPQSLSPRPSPATSTVAAAASRAPSASSANASVVASAPLTIEPPVPPSSPAPAAPLPLTESTTLPPLSFAPRTGTDSTVLPPQAPSFIPSPDLMDEVPSTSSAQQPPVLPQPEPRTAPLPGSNPVAPASLASPGTTAANPDSEEAIPLTALPRADFGIRMLALLIDVVLVSMILKFSTSFLPRFIHVDFWNGVALLSTIYGAILWKHRGATIGDIILRLQVIRTDDRPIDWTTSIVRGLGCLLSAFALGIGFLWIAIDRDREAWHDKIAGTAVVRLPRNRPMV